MAYARTPEILEPEVLPPERDDNRLPPGKQPNRLAWILVGMILDVLDLVSLGPVGLKIGFPLGAFAGYALFSLLKLPPKRRLLYSLAAGLYCALPGTGILPLGTLLALLMKLPRTKK